MKQLIIVLIAAISVFGMRPVEAKETVVIVRAKAKDAKFIGSSLGGAYVVVRDQRNGQVLAEGKTSGTTGNTALVMTTPRERHQSIVDEHTAGFRAVLELDEPTFIRIEVTAPANKGLSQIQATTELWLIPGKHILGDGVVLEIPGFIVDILTPRTHQYIPLAELEGKPLEVRANIVMMCGCLIESGGLWDADEMEVRATLKKDGTVIGEIELTCTEPNLFGGSFEIGSRGNYEVLVSAYTARTGNTGVDQLNFVVH